MRSAINEGQKARYLESKNFSICESELQKSTLKECLSLVFSY